MHTQPALTATHNVRPATAMRVLGEGFVIRETSSNDWYLDQPKSTSRSNLV